MDNQRSLFKSILLGLAVVAGIIVYAYGFQVTKVDFSETRSERRLQVLSRILRALAHPDLITYDVEEVTVQTPFYLPCPSEPVEIEPPDTSGPYLVTDVSCASAEEFVEVKGYNFPVGSRGPISFFTQSGVKLQIENFSVGESGEFEARVKLPNRQPVAEPQYIIATARVDVGAPKFTSTARVTWAKIVETVFLALLATTVGTALAIPLSFVAARNLMSQIKSPPASMALNVIGFPIGVAAGLLALRVLRPLTVLLSTNSLVNLVSLAAGLGLAYTLFRYAFKQDPDEQMGPTANILRIILLVIAALLVFLTLELLGLLAKSIGSSIIGPLGAFGFLGYFIAQMGDVFQIVTPALIMLSGGMVVSSSLGSLGQRISDSMPAKPLKLVNLALTTIAGALLFVLIASLIDWFYQFDNPFLTIWGPAATGGLLGLILALRVNAKATLPTGITIYFIMRTILNATRSVEPLVMVIVFVAWVGIGPFAGALALALHTIAALSKLYSEQVESIMPGPLEAIQATGANRLQTIVYAVVPQIIPPYISFTMYRWDINVRMSTIIGFAGGGGIGFLLQQNINLLDYRAASMQMLAIAIVVASMDYLSSTLRERFV
ncbi:MAG: ABC transporter permease subunit [Anaerolineales bacterium]